ncbi:MAG: sigma-E processing peptidase SpoIIGA [Bacilli bacterium]|nr:sigma-E processing peptidase SpoIIGA [Bacilli bacterium]
MGRPSGGWKMPTIYLDVIWIENFCMDLWILFVAGLLGKYKFSIWRLVLGTAAASFISLMVFVPVVGGVFSSWAGKIAASFLIVYVSFSWQGLRTFLKQTALFYLSSFMTGGVVLAVSFFGAGSFGGLQIINDRFTWQVNLGTSALLGSLPVVYGCIQLLFRAKRQNHTFKHRFPVIIRVGDTATQVFAMIDTGNSLVDPISHAVVSICVCSAVSNLLPKKLWNIYEKGEDAVLQLGSVELDPDFEARIRIIPYHGVGGSAGMLLAFTPDEWWTLQDGRKTMLSGLIALQTGALSHSDSYQMILHPDAPMDNQTTPLAVGLKGASFR